jgi:alanine-synthesizing transaminase
MQRRLGGMVVAMSPFLSRLESARASARPLLDLTEPRPERSGLAAEGDADLASPAAGDTAGTPDAGEAIARYLADRAVGLARDRVVLTTSAHASYEILLRLLCGPGDAVLVPSPCRPLLDPLAARLSVETPRYPLRYRGEWRLDRKALARAVTPRTRAVVVASPANPTGALISRDEMAFLEELCEAKGLALVGDEAWADTALEPAPSVAAASRCLAFHLSGLSTVCGAPRLASWIAVAGPAPLVAPALARLESLAAEGPGIAPAAARAVPALLARRESFLDLLRRRLSSSRAMLATAALREAPWALLWGAGGWFAVLQIGGAYDEEALCLRLLDRGVVVRPGFLDGFERNGYLVLSLLTDPATLAEGLGRLESLLRAPI